MFCFGNQHINIGLLELFCCRQVIQNLFYLHWNLPLKVVSFYWLLVLNDILTKPCRMLSNITCMIFKFSQNEHKWKNTEELILDQYKNFWLLMKDFLFCDVIYRLFFLVKYSFEYVILSNFAFFFTHTRMQKYGQFSNGIIQSGQPTKQTTIIFFYPNVWSPTLSFRAIICEGWRPRFSYRSVRRSRIMDGSYTVNSCPSTSLTLYEDSKCNI